MKKTTIRTVGVLFVAACVALLASCNQSTTPVKPEKKAPPPITVQFKGLWKVLEWMDNDLSSSSNVYYFAFDKDGQLRLAYDPSTASDDDIITRAATVAVEGEGTDKIKIKELGLDEAKKFTLDDDILTIAGSKKTVLAKVTNLTAIDKKIKDLDSFTKDIDGRNPQKVVYNFNKTLLNFGSYYWTPSTSNDTVFEITKLHGKDAGEKKNTTDKKTYYFGMPLANGGKYIIAVDQDNKCKTTLADYSITYTLGSPKMKITVDALKLKDVPFTYNPSDQSLAIGKGDTMTHFKTSSETYSNISAVGYAESNDNVTKAIANFDKKEE